MWINIWTVDSFSKTPFAGNPAAVCLLRDPLEFSDEKMQKIAAEMNISETAFCCPSEAGQPIKDCRKFKLRWFTPKKEVSLCGHATLAASAVLFFETEISSQVVEFETLSGILEATRDGNDKICMKLPLNPPNQEIPSEIDMNSLLQAVLGKGEELKPFELKFNVDTKKLLIRLNDQCSISMLESIHPDFAAMLAVDPDGIHVRGVIVTLAGSGFDFISRYFAPWVGIPEDPVTGAAHTVLAAYWSEKLQKKIMCARQCSARGGILDLKVEEDALRVSGAATIIIRGQMRVE